MSFQPEKLLRRGVESLKAYVPGRRIEDVVETYGLDSVCKLASNENALGSSPLAVSAIRGVLDGVHRYPDGDAGALRKRLAEKMGVKEAEVFVGNGGDDVLSVLARTFLNDGEEAVIPEPTFSPYAHVTRVMGGKVVPSPLRDYRVDLEDVRSRVNDRTKLVFLCSPNNPTGTIIKEKELLSFMENLRPNILVLLDEAYGDFVDDPDWPDSLVLIEKFPLIILRSFSKIYGLAGLRVGYGIGGEELIKFMHRVREPFNVNQLAQVAAVAALNDEDFRQRSVQMVRKERAKIYRELKRMKIPYIESQANFIFLRIGSGDRVTKNLMRRGIIVRPGSAFGCPEWIRMTVGLPEENDLFFNEIKELGSLEGD